jgi:hypothetical protein
MATVQYSGFCTTMFLVFLVLKLCNIISWSWWWVASPLWAPAALALVVLVLAAPFILVGWLKA